MQYTGEWHHHTTTTTYVCCIAVERYHIYFQPTKGAKPFASAAEIHIEPILFTSTCVKLQGKPARGRNLVVWSFLRNSLKDVFYCSFEHV